MSTTDNKNNDGKKPDAFRKTSAWARPRAMARDSNVSAWLALAGIICLCLALWTPIAHVFWGIRNRNVDHNESLPRNANCFLAISYEGISPVPDPSGRFIFAQDFRAHIAALKNAGYHAIGLEDVRAFYEDHRPLPPKAILLTFENTRKNTFFEGRAILEDLNWRAVMGVITRRVNSKDRDTILWPYLKSMAMDDRWDLACESSNGVGFIAADSQGLRAPFFATRKWLFNESRFESVDEFKSASTQTTPPQSATSSQNCTRSQSHSSFPSATTANSSRAAARSATPTSTPSPNSTSSASSSTTRR